jgi:hypothetical protein
MSYMESSLWKRTLGDDSPFSGSEHRKILETAFTQFRDVVKPLAGEISRSMEMFTDHSIEHVDSLWDIASAILQEDFPMNPAEAFVLGGAFLLHDLGMGLVAYPGGVVEVERDPLYLDLIAIRKNKASKKVDGSSVSHKEDDETARQRAIAAILRMRHAKQAERLILQEFSTSGGQPFYLLENTNLRNAYGSMIGKIAHSHWWDVSELPQRFPTIMGSHAQFPREWTVDPLKLACILRLSDAAHIDSRRAPTYLHAFRKPPAESREHWYFQEHLNRPNPVGDRFEYTSNRSFLGDESRAWWLAFETIQMIDAEFRAVDALCADENKPRFAIRSVVGADSPERFARSVPTEGWTPIDARLKVSEVESVISTLGGVDLYGRSREIALRELIANAADATRARQLQHGGSDAAIKVRIWQEGDEHWMQVEDQGIGLDASSLVSSLTDFGVSRWDSIETMSEYPGLLRKGYQPRGRFGIGFFAVFMAADFVEVLSLKYGEAARTTSKLVFSDGVHARPLLMAADQEEQLVLGGTRVRAKLKHDPLSDEGLLGTKYLKVSKSNMLKDNIRQLAALLDVDLLVQGPEDEHYERIVVADEWKTLPARDLFRMLYKQDLEERGMQSMYLAWEDIFAEHARDLRNSEGDIVGRAIVAAGFDSTAPDGVWWWPSPLAHIYVGGLRSDTIYDCLGVFVGLPLKADRNSAFPVASSEEIKAWATSQADLVENSHFATASTRYGAADLIRSVGVPAANLPCAYGNNGEIPAAALEAWITGKEEIYWIGSGELYLFHRDGGSLTFIDRTKGEQILLEDNMLVLDLYSRWFYPDEVVPRPKDDRFSDYGDLTSDSWNPRHFWHLAGNVGSPSLILSAAASVWGRDPISLGAGLERLILDKNGDARIELRTGNGGSTKLDAFRLSRNSGPC